MILQRDDIRWARPRQLTNTIRLRAGHCGGKKVGTKPERRKVDRFGNMEFRNENRSSDNGIMKDHLVGRGVDSGLRMTFVVSTCAGTSQSFRSYLK